MAGDPEAATEGDDGSRYGYGGYGSGYDAIGSYGYDHGDDGGPASAGIDYAAYGAVYRQGPYGGGYFTPGGDLIGAYSFFGGYDPGVVFLF